MAETRAGSATHATAGLKDEDQRERKLYQLYAPDKHTLASASEDMFRRRGSHTAVSNWTCLKSPFLDALVNKWLTTLRMCCYNRVIMHTPRVIMTRWEKGQSRVVPLVDGFRPSGAPATTRPSISHRVE